MSKVKRRRTRECERTGIGTENGGQQTENGVSGSGAVSRRVKKRWSGSGAGSGLNRPLKFLSTVSVLKLRNALRSVFDPKSKIKIISSHNSNSNTRSCRIVISEISETEYHFYKCMTSPATQLIDEIDAIKRKFEKISVGSVQAAWSTVSKHHSLKFPNFEAIGVPT